MSDYISREAVLEAVLALPPKMDEQGYGWLGRRGVWQMISDFPAADVWSARRGKWEDVEVQCIADKTTLPFERISSMRCNRCNRYHTEIFYYGNPTEMAHFCPNCGADMRGGADD